MEFTNIKYSLLPFVLPTIDDVKKCEEWDTSANYEVLM